FGLGRRGNVQRSRRQDTMDIKYSGSQPSGKGPGEYFTGSVRIDPLFDAPDPARTRGATVTFEPCARTAWHTHPLGQTLIITAGCGHLPRPISEEGRRAHTYEVGQIAYWAPGPDVAIYYRQDGQPIPDPGIVVLGTINRGVEAFDIPGATRVTIELVK